MTEFDKSMMAAAVGLASKGMMTTHPNPAVGCVIVKDNRIIAEGWHQYPGQGHAEVNALSQINDASGCDCYVTLEPCSHTGKTPPCADALIKAGVKRVVIGMTDPNPQVSGRGIEKLKKAGIEVEVGCLTSQCEALNPGFIHRMKTGKPWVVCKMASSLDGATAMASGESQWITGKGARSDVQQHRAIHHAILTGAGTVLADNPKLNVRPKELPVALPQDMVLRQPVKIVVDNKFQITPDLALFSDESPVILVTPGGCYGVEFPDFVTIMPVNNIEGRVDLEDMLMRLGSEQINSIWIEAGSRLAGAMFEHRLVNQLILYMAGKLLGSNTRRLLDMELDNLSQAIDLDIQDVQTIDNDIRITAGVKYP